MSKKEQPPSPRRVLKIGSQETASFQVNKDDILQNKVPRSALSKAEIADPESSEVRALSELEKNCYREKYRYAFYWWGDQAKIPEPYPVSFEIKIKQIEIGGKHFMALSENGKVYSWGVGSSGQLGHGTKGTEKTPKLIEFFENCAEVKRIYCNAAQSAALTVDNKLYTWGWKGEGTVTVLPELSKDLVGFDVLQVVLGFYHIAVLVASQEGERDVYSWGSGSKGQLGHGDFVYQEVPKVIMKLKGSHILAIGAASCCTAAVSLYGDVFMWGLNENGVLGVDSKSPTVTVPEVVIGFEGVTVVKIICGDRFTVIVSNIGEVFAWGKNDKGQLGQGNMDHPIVPYPLRVKLLAGIQIEGVSVGHDHLVAWSSSEVYSWGSNRDGRLGLGINDEFTSSPRIVDALRGRAIFDISCGSKSVVACVGQGLFGRDLSSVTDQRYGIPLIVKESIDYLKKHAATEGLFRISPNDTVKNLMASWWEAGYLVHMAKCPYPHVVSSLLKYFLYTLPDSLLTEKLFYQFIALEEEETLDIFLKLEGLKILVNQLPPANRNVLKELLELLYLVYENRNNSLMDIQNLSNVFAPTLFKAINEIDAIKLIQPQIQIIKKMIRHHKAIFSTNTPDLISILSKKLTKSDVKSDIEKIQRKYFAIFQQNWNEKSERFNLRNGSMGNFKKAFLESNAAAFILQSCLINFPAEEFHSFLREILGTLPNYSSDTILNIVEGLSYFQLGGKERKYLATLLMNYLNENKEKSGIISSNNLIDFQSVNDEKLIQLLKRNESLFEGIQSLSSSSENNSSDKVDEENELEGYKESDFLFSLANHQKNLDEELIKLKDDLVYYEKFGEKISQREIDIDKQLTDLTNQIVQYQTEFNKVDEEKRTFQSEISKLNLNTSSESQRHHDELEGLNRNVSFKEELLKTKKNSSTEFEKFFEVYLIPTINFLQQLQIDFVDNLKIISKDSVTTLDKYVDNVIELFSELRKKLSRVKKDLRKMANYGENVTSLLKFEYDKVKEITNEIIVDYQQTKSLADSSLLSPLRLYLEYCGEMKINAEEAKENELKTYLETKNITTGNFEILLHGFGYPPLPPPPKVIPLARLSTKIEAAEAHISYITKRHFKDWGNWKFIF